MTRALLAVSMIALLGCDASNGADQSFPTTGGAVEYPPDGNAGIYPVDALSAAERDAAQKHAQAVCAAVGSCCGASGRTVDAFCVENGLALLANDAVSTRRAGATFDLTALSACTSAITGALGSCSATNRDAVLSACGAVFGGTKNPGDGCTADDECGRPAGAFALCDGDSEDAARCIDGKCQLLCKPPAHPFDTWKTCASVSGGLDQDSVCSDRCYYPAAGSGSVCMMVCTCCVDNTNQTCEYTAFRTAQNYHHYLCTGGHFSTECQAARINADRDCDSWR
jgi:hypothetical protein